MTVVVLVYFYICLSVLPCEKFCLSMSSLSVCLFVCLSVVSLLCYSSLYQCTADLNERWWASSFSLVGPGMAFLFAFGR